MLIDKKIAFLGGGNMAEALIRGLIAAGTANPGHILVADLSADRQGCDQGGRAEGAAGRPGAARGRGLVGRPRLSG